jgi:hypothetical protein
MGIESSIGEAKISDKDRKWVDLCTAWGINEKFG